METLQCELEPFLQLDSLVNFAIKKKLALSESQSGR